MPVCRERVSVLHNIMQGAPTRGTGDGCRAAWGDFAVLRTASSVAGGKISAAGEIFLDAKSVAFYALCHDISQGNIGVRASEICPIFGTYVTGKYKRKKMHKCTLLLLIVLVLSDVRAEEIPGVHEHLAHNDPYRESALTYTVDHCETNRHNNFLCIFHNNRDAQNRMLFGKLAKNTISHAIYELPDIDYVANFYSARFLDFNHTPLLEVFIATNQGNGEIYVYQVGGNDLQRIFHTHAIDAHAEMSEHILTPNGEIVRFNWDDPSQNPHGHLIRVSRVFQDGTLKATYIDTNHDSYEDLLLEGSIQTEIENEHAELMPQHDLALKRVFLWNQDMYTFIEDKKRRIGPSYYFEHIDH